MRVLLDECLPRRLRALLVGHEVQTVPGAGWAGRTNGELLRLATGNYDVFITMDQGLRYQQNLESARLTVVVLVASSNRLDALEALVPSILATIAKASPGYIIRVGDRR